MKRTTCAWAIPRLVIIFVAAVMPFSFAASGAEAPKVAFKPSAGRWEIQIGGQSVATYVYEDSLVTRPHFCEVKTLQGVPVTRPNPPDPIINKDNDDHATFHPGIWLAFGDVNGEDYWRNKARVRHVKFVEPSLQEPGMGRFTVVNRYEKGDGQGVAAFEETCTYTVRVYGSGYFIFIRTAFQSDSGDLAFGDQEEMGLGVRLNTPLTVKFGSGTILNSEDGRNEEGTWGRQSRWCSYWGVVDGKKAGIALMPAPGNFRPSWFHTRNYGLMVANAFGKKSMTAPDDKAVVPDQTCVRKGESFPLGYGVYIFGGSSDAEMDVSKAYDECVRQLESK